MGLIADHNEDRRRLFRLHLVSVEDGVRRDLGRGAVRLAVALWFIRIADV